MKILLVSRLSTNSEEGSMGRKNWCLGLRPLFCSQAQSGQPRGEWHAGPQKFGSKAEQMCFQPPPPLLSSGQACVFTHDLSTPLFFTAHNSEQQHFPKRPVSADLHTSAKYMATIFYRTWPCASFHSKPVFSCLFTFAEIKTVNSMS